MKEQYLVSVEARYVVTATSEAEAEAFAIAAAECCGVDAPGIYDRVDCRGTDLVCCTKE